jgi:hypothetical protein
VEQTKSEQLPEVDELEFPVEVAPERIVETAVFGQIEVAQTTVLAERI